MTDQELNKALALKIGYLPDDVGVFFGVVVVQREPLDKLKLGGLWFKGRRFDFMDWSTIMPIALKYGIGIGISQQKGYFVFGPNDGGYFDNPLQKAIALAVLNNP